MSQREAEVLEAVGRHLSNAQIASRLHISVRTVESHVSSLLRKLGAADRRELAELAPAAAGRPRPADGGGPLIGMPATRTSFIGRDREQATVLAALAGSRMVSLVGPGGVGKTRLAAKAAETAAAGYPFGGVFVDLVPVREGFITQAVATLLGVTERSDQSLDAALHEFLGRGRSLLVLDNCEHLLGVVAAFVEKLLADCAGLTVLVTSRERLAIPGERTVTVPPLSLVPTGNGGAAWSEAAALFMARAQASEPEFSAAADTVREVCRRLDGVPLAIELAAARSASLGVDGLLAGLDDHLRLLAGSRGPHERHRSLRAVIDWSHDLLDEDERALFRRLGAFIGGFDLDAAVATSACPDRGEVADLVGRLTDKSLLIHHRGAEGSRWRMLGTIRSYALAQLAASGEAAAVQDAHLRWAVATASELENRLQAGHPGADPAWRAAFDVVADDLRGALARVPWTPAASAAPLATPSFQSGPAPAERGGGGPGGDGLRHRLARSLGHLAYARRFMVESGEHYRAAAQLAAKPIEAAADLRTAADVALAHGASAAAFDLLLAAADRAEQAGDACAQATSLAFAATIADRFWADFPSEVPHSRIRDLYGRAAAACPAGDPVSAAYLAAAAAWTGPPDKTVPDPALADHALAAARRADDPVLISAALDAVVGVLDAGGHLRQAHQANRERARLLGRLSRHDPRAGIEIVDTVHMVTEIAVTAGDLPDALATARMAKDDDIAGGQPHMTASKPVFPLVLQGKFEQACEQAADMWEAWERAGRPAGRRLAPATFAMILACGLRGDEDGRRDWERRLGELIGPEEVAGSNLAAVAAFTQARLAVHEGRLDAAVAATADLPLEAEPWYETPRWSSLRPYAWAMAAEVAVLATPDTAESRLAAAAPAGAENYWAGACLARAAGRLRGDTAQLELAVAGWERIEARFERACTLLLLADRAAEGQAELRALGCPPPAGRPADG